MMERDVTPNNWHHPPTAIKKKYGTAAPLSTPAKRRGRTRP